MKKIVMSAIIFGFISSAEADTSGIESSVRKCINTTYSANIPARCEPVFDEIRDYKIKHSKTKECDLLLDVIDFRLSQFHGDAYSKIVAIGALKELKTDCP